MKDWQVITTDVLNALDITTRIKFITYIMQSEFTNTTYSCISTFSWSATNEGYKYWHKLYSTHSTFPHEVEITEIQKLIQSLYPRETYPEYYI